MERCYFHVVKEYDVVIVGGGLAGLTSAIALSKEGFDVLVFEPNKYPHHKVCGEYVSNEVVPYLESLGVALDKAGAVPITDFQISAVDGRFAEAKLPLGGIGISRYALDHTLYKRALEVGVNFIFSKVSSINFQNDAFQVNTASEVYKAFIVIGAYGKRDALDKTLNRNFSFQKHAWLAVKAHYKSPDFSDNLVALHNFPGGYGGLSKTESGAVNFCYLAHYDSFKKYPNIDDFNQKIVAQNKNLDSFFKVSEPLFEKPLTIAQIAFERKEPVVNHILMCGDTAGLIHPLCGNGMAMAIHSAKLASDCIVTYLESKSKDRSKLEKDYQKRWHTTFSKRLWYGRKLQQVLLHKKWVNSGVGLAASSGKILRYIIRKTHGKPIV